MRALNEIRRGNLDERRRWLQKLKNDRIAIRATSDCTAAAAEAPKNLIMWVDLSSAEDVTSSSEEAPTTSADETAAAVSPTPPSYSSSFETSAGNRLRDETFVVVRDRSEDCFSSSISATPTGSELVTSVPKRHHRSIADVLRGFLCIGSSRYAIF